MLINSFLMIFCRDCLNVKITREPAAKFLSGSGSLSLLKENVETEYVWAEFENCFLLGKHRY